MSKKDGAMFSRSLFGYKKRDVNEYIRIADENNSEKIKECEVRIKELENGLSEEKKASQIEISRLVENNEAAAKNAEDLKLVYEAKLAESEARAISYLKLADDANQRADLTEAKNAELLSALDEKETKIKELEDRIDASEKYISELNATVARHVQREENEKREQAKYIKLRRPLFFRFIKK